MGIVERRDDRGDELGLDLELRACAVCRRELLPWQDRCPEDGGEGVPRDQLPPPVDPLLRRLLEQDD